MTACRLELRMRTTFILVHGGLLASSQALGFQRYRGVTRCHYPPPRLLLFALEDDNEELDDLTPPSVSFTRNSVLFGENPPTQRSNGPLWLWQGAKKILPPFVTGAWEVSKGDKKPVDRRASVQLSLRSCAGSSSWNPVSKESDFGSSISNELWRWVLHSTTPGGAWCFSVDSSIK